MKQFFFPILLACYIYLSRSKNTTANFSFFHFSTISFSSKQYRKLSTLKKTSTDTGTQNFKKELQLLLNIAYNLLPPDIALLFFNHIYTLKKTSYENKFKKTENGREKLKQ